MPRISVYLLGTPRIECDGEPLKFTHRKALALLAYLALNPGAQSREFLATLLWPEANTKRAYAYLRNALWQLSQIPLTRWFITDRETIEFRMDEELWLDVSRVNNLVDLCQTHDHPETEVCASCVPLLSEAAALHMGSFMEGFSLGDSVAYDDWQFYQAARLLDQLAGVLQRLVHWHSEHADYQKAIDCARRWLALDPLHEPVHRQLMRLYAWEGQHSTALRQYQECVRLLKDELGVPPSEETMALYEEIRTRKLEQPTQIPATPVIGVDKDTGATISSVPAEKHTTTDTVQLITPEEPQSLAGARRAVTALVASVKSFKAAQDDDLETWVEMMLDVIPVLENEVQRFGGEVSQVRNDGLLVLFGLTTAHEDDPERAVLAGLEMQERFRDVASNLPEDLTLRVGISTGEVIATSIGDQQRTNAVLGRVTALAERMGEAAESGTVLVAESTHRLVEPLFAWKMMGRFQVLGVRAPVGVFRPLAHKDLLTKGRGIEGLASVLVGRDEEYRALQDAVERLKAGMGGIVTVVGEAGIGKSRLVAEVKSWALEKENEVKWMEGRCLSYATNVAYHLWTDMLRLWLDITAETQPENTAEVLRVKVREVCPDEYGEVTPFLARLLSLPLDEASAARIRGIAAGGMQVLTHRAFETLVVSLSQRHPLVLVCEDLHWAGPTSLGLLEHVLPLTDRVPLLLVCVMRPVMAHSCWQVRELAAREYRHRYTDVWLEALTTSASGELIGNLLRIEDLPRELRERILERAEGNPFFLEEILRSLIEDEAIIYEPVTELTTGLETGHWVATGEINDLSIPDTLHGVLTARIDRLDPRVKKVLQLASVIGRTFSYGVLEAIAENVDFQEYDSYLITLQRAELIREKARLPEREYIFKHVLTQEAVYNTLLKRERRTIHRQVAESIENLNPDRVEEQLGLLAYHWEQAGDTKQAVTYLRKAGEQAAVQYANAEAVDYFSRAHSLVPEENAALRYDLLLSREKVYDLMGKRDLQADDLAELAGLAENLDAANPQPGKSRRAEVALRQIHLAIRTGKYSKANKQVQEILPLAQKSQDRYAEAAAYREWGRALFYEMKFSDSLSKFEKALSMARNIGIPQIEVDSLHTLGAVYLNIDLSKAQSIFEQELRICLEINNRNCEGIALRDLSYVFLGKKAYAKSLSFAEQSLQVCRQTGNRRDEGFALSRIGFGYLIQNRGNYAEIEDCAMQALKIFLEVQDLVGLFNVYGLLGRVAMYQEDIQKVLSYDEQALKTFRHLGHRQYESGILASTGYFLLNHGRYTEAQHYLEQALVINREIGLRRTEGGNLCDLGQLHFILGDYEGAKTQSIKSIDIARDAKSSYIECNCLILQGFIALTLGDVETAITLAEQVLAIGPQDDDIFLQGLAKLVLGHANADLGYWDEALEGYDQSIQIIHQAVYMSPNRKTGLTLEATAGIARIKLACDDYMSALSQVERILSELEKRPWITFAWEPFRVYLTCVQVLEANGDPRAKEVLEQAYNLLMERAATIEDAALHRSYLENVPENREIVAAWERVHKSEE